MDQMEEMRYADIVVIPYRIITSISSSVDSPMGIMLTPLKELNINQERERKPAENKTINAVARISSALLIALNILVSPFVS